MIIVIVVFVVVPIIITIVLAGMLYFWVSTWAPPKIETPSANLSTPMKNVTASTYYYNMTVLNTSEPIEPKYVRVEFYSFFTLYGRVNLSATRGEYKQVKEYDERDYDIYVMWQDTNLNNKLDANDEISIKSTSGLDWQKVKLWYDRPWAWGTIAEVELP